jgi:hypothetical protein
MWGQGGNDNFYVSIGGGSDTVHGGTGTDYLNLSGGSGGSWLESVASGATPTLGAGDWLLQLDSGEAYVLHGTGGSFDFAATHAGVLTGADGTNINFDEFEGVRW